jgi:hypothetical protein
MTWLGLQFGSTDAIFYDSKKKEERICSFEGYL